MGENESPGKKNNWFPKTGLGLVAIVSWFTAIESGLDASIGMWPQGLLFLISAIVSTALLIMFDRIEGAGFDAYFVAAVPFLAALSFRDESLILLVIALIGALGLILIEEKRDPRSGERLYSIRPWKRNGS